MTIAVVNKSDPIPLEIGTLNFTAEQFERLCVANPNRSLELTSKGELVVMPPVGGESGRCELKLGARVLNWNE